ncbi:MAG: PAS domain S-box protein [Pseudanabaenaceae cyanobacterium]
MHTKQLWSVLIVGGVPLEQQVYIDYLQREEQRRYLVHYLPIGTEAISYCQNEDVDLVIVNETAHPNHALDFLRHFAHQVAPHYLIAVLVMMEQNNEDFVIEAIKNGGQEFLLKSYVTPMLLRQKVSTLLERMSLLREVSERKEQQRLISDIALRIRESLDLRHILATCVAEVRHLLNVDRVLIYRVLPDGQGNVMAESVGDGWSQCLGHNIQDQCFQEHKGEAYRQGFVLAINDVEESPLTPCHRQLLRRFEVRAQVVVPIVLLPSGNKNHNLSEEPQSELWGLLILHQCRQIRLWRNSEKNLLNHLAVQLSVAIQQAELLEDLKNLNQELQHYANERNKALQISEQKFRAIFNNTFQFVGLLDLNGVLLEANQTALDFAGITAAEVINKPFWDAHWWSDQPTSQEKLRDAVHRATQGEFMRYEVEVRGAGTSRAIIDFSLRPIRNDDGEIIFLVPEGRDISSLKQTERELQELNQDLEHRVAERTLALQEANQILHQRSQEFRALVENSPDTVARFDRDCRILYINSMVEKNTGLPTTHYIGRTVSESLNDWELSQQWDECIQNCFRTKEEVDFAYELPNIEGITKYYQSRFAPEFAPDGSVNTVLVVSRDVTDLYQAEQKYRNLIEQIPGVVYMSPLSINADHSHAYISPYLEKMLGIKSEDWQAGFWQTWNEYVHPDDRERVITAVKQILDSQKSVCMEYRMYTQDKRLIWVRDEACMVMASDRKTQVLQGIALDISDSKFFEEKLKSSLQEKEVILKEIHHRVKNNLYIISSLLKLQSNISKEPHIVECFRESQNRIQSMALIHEKLYQSSDLVGINFADYTKKLVLDIFRSHGVSVRRISLDLQITDIFLDIDTAIPCGLILNELTSNVLKYAFPPNQSGIISISFICIDDRYTLKFTDNGVGMTQNGNIEHNTSLGLRLVLNLTKQLNGNLTITTERGTSFSITFPKKSKYLG